MDHNFEAFLKKYENLTKEEAIYEMFKSNCDLQQRIDNTINLIHAILKNPEAYSGKDNVGNILSILQDEKVDD